MAGVLESTTGLRAHEITERLKDAGVTVRGKTSLSRRVQHELRRLRQKGLITRDDDGRYQLRADGRGLARAVAN